MIANDPLADNTDLYAFRSPDDPEYITIIAGYVPLQLPQGGPNYYSFGTDVFTKSILRMMLPPQVTTLSINSDSGEKMKIQPPSLTSGLGLRI